MAQSFLQIEGLTKSFGDLVLFENISLGINEGDRVGLIAKNGSGKTTLLNVIAGIEGKDAGSIVFRSDLRMDYLSQDPQFPPEITVGEVCRCRREGNEWVLDERKGEQDVLTNASRLTRILTQLRITDMQQRVGTLSGGQKKRLALAHVLIDDPQLLILDEPTNHLDLDMVEWLEDYLSHTRMTLLMVTHDRYFLDHVCNRIVELADRTLYTYRGNYEYYLEKRAERLEVQASTVERAQNLMRKELDWMRRQPQARGHKSRSRIEAFYELEQRAKARRHDMEMRLSIRSAYIGSKIFNAHKVYKAYGDKVLLRDFNYEFARYEKVGIVGANGTGKSTFLKMLLGLEPTDGGHFAIGETVRFGYYSQDGLAFDGQKKVIDVVRDVADVVQMSDGSRLTATQLLQHFLFAPSRQYDYVHKLSGGERRRLYLCTILMRAPNFLVLDEPTNDLDIMTLQVLEQYLQDFGGCVIVVSHDRYFMDKVVDHLFVFHGDGVVQDYPGNYTDYRQWRELKEAEAREAAEATAPKTAAAAAPPTDAKAKPKTERAPRLTFKERQELADLDARLPQLTAERAALEEQMSSGTMEADALLEAGRRIAELIEEIDTMEMRWLELSEKA